VKKLIAKGWPNSKMEIDPAARPYFDVRDELAEQDGLIFKGSRVIIPKAGRPHVIKQMHNSHMGIASSLRRARDLVYWPGMNSDIKQAVEQCDTC